MKSSPYRRLGAVALWALIVTAVAMPVFAQAEADKKIEQGRLKLIGKGIEHFVLVDANRKRHEFNAPGEVLSLPPGEYHPEQVGLTGGLYSRASGYSFKIDPNSTTEFKMGAPLTQTLTINRKGKILQLGYELRGIGGEEYTPNNRSNAPKFAVYKGDTKVGGGKFEFG